MCARALKSTPQAPALAPESVSALLYTAASSHACLIRTPPTATMARDRALARPSRLPCALAAVLCVVATAAARLQEGAEKSLSEANLFNSSTTRITYRPRATTTAATRTSRGGLARQGPTQLRSRVRGRTKRPQEEGAEPRAASVDQRSRRQSSCDTNCNSGCDTSTSCDDGCVGVCDGMLIAAAAGGCAGTAVRRRFLRVPRPRAHAPRACPSQLRCGGACAPLRHPGARTLFGPGEEEGAVWPRAVALALHMCCLPQVARPPFAPTKTSSAVVTAPLCTGVDTPAESQGAVPGPRTSRCSHTRRWQRLWRARSRASRSRLLAATRPRVITGSVIAEQVKCLHAE